MPDLAALKLEVAQATHHAERGRQHIKRQMNLIDELDRDGHDTNQARELLETFLQTQSMHEADLARLQAELASTVANRSRPR
jgi:hypothetical protein